MLQEGELEDLLDELSEGKVQFAYDKVLDPNTGLHKNVLIAWCGEGVPERTKGYFTSYLSVVSKFLHVSNPVAQLKVDMPVVLTQWKLRDITSNLPPELMGT